MQLLSYNVKACIINIMISKYRASKISQSRNIVTPDIIDKIIEADINSQINRSC